MKNKLDTYKDYRGVIRFRTRLLDEWPIEEEIK